ncbi:MAG: MMPL family transporter, partial [Pirellulales bacterium]|nr:MMPL family transporter [Pirellulales bacterium]
SSLVSEDGRTLKPENIYLGALGELLASERMPTPVWLDPADPDAPFQLDSEVWGRMVKAGYFDAVVWVGGAGVQESHFDGVGKLIDARAIEHKTVRPTLNAGVPDVEGSGALQMVYTGAIPIVYKAQRTLLSSLANSIGMAFVLIAAVMVMLLNPGRLPLSVFRPGNLGNGLAAGMVSMIPNVFPVLLIFGLMCHWDIEIDIGTMMTASVAMGVAVDDTIHFLSWFRAHLDRGMDRVEAVIETYKRVGPAMTQTTIVGGLGLFVFALSTFTPTQRFGTLMLVLLAAALVGDLILLPALLAGPAGRWFKPRVGARPTDDTPRDDLSEQQTPRLATPETDADDRVGDTAEEVVGDSPEESIRPSAVIAHPGQSSRLRVHFPNDGSRTRRFQ